MRASYLDAGLWLRRRVDHPRLRRVEDLGRLGYGHHFRLDDASQIDDALRALMREAYLAGTAPREPRRSAATARARS